MTLREFLEKELGLFVTNDITRPNTVAVSGKLFATAATALDYDMGSIDEELGFIPFELGLEYKHNDKRIIFIDL